MTNEAAEPNAVQVRPEKVRRVAVAAAVFFVVVFTVVGIVLPNSATGAHFRSSDQVAMIGIGVLLACGSLLLARPCLRADAEGVEIRNIVTTHRYPWSMVRSFSFPDGAMFARMELPADEYVSVLAIQSVDRERAVQAMRELRRLRRSLGEAP